MIIGVDTGGTFTDFVFVKNGKWHIFKLPSTPKNPAEAVVEGIKRITSGVDDFLVLHGSTVATNTILERKGAKVALITNEGFEDVIEIQRQNRRKIYRLCYRKPRPLVPRHLRFGIKGRVDAKGRVVEEIDENEVRKLSEKLKGLGVESIAISMLFCFLHPEHEERIAEILRENFSHVYTSSSILPVFREYERTSTVVINAYVAPKMGSYLRQLASSFGEERVKIMQSNGGSISLAQAAREPVRTVLSGPAGGVVAAQFLGRLAGYENIITLDMGGTSTDVSLIDGGRFQLTTEYEIDGLSIGVQVINIHTIGAGGGSIAYLDEGGALKVGPESAGADPGPVCYGKGDRITITDANLFLGRIVPEYFLGGDMRVYPERVKDYLKPLAEAMGKGLEDAALGIITVANSNMEAAIRVVSVERGYDPRDFVLLVFGGAAPLHAASLARAMSIPKVVVPRFPGAFSAVGILLSDVVKDYSITVMLESPSYRELLDVLKSLMKKASEDMEREGFAEFSSYPFILCRFRGQSYEVEVPLVENYREAFERAYAKLYGYCPVDGRVEVVNLGLRAVAAREKPEYLKLEAGSRTPEESALLGYRRLFAEKGWVKAPVYLRDGLLVGNVLEGPALVVEYSSTTYVPEDFRLTVDEWGNLVMEKKE